MLDPLWSNGYTNWLSSPAVVLGHANGSKKFPRFQCFRLIESTCTE